MRIISSFHDYYDGVQNQGIDKDCIYLREIKEIQILPTHIVKENTISRYEKRDYKISLSLLGFCGKIYHIFTISDPNYAQPMHFYNFDEFKFVCIFRKILSERDFDRKRWWGQSHYINFLEQNLSSAMHLFHIYQTPIFVISAIPNSEFQKLILNPCLKTFNFQTQKDPFTAYQDIHTYLGCILTTPEKEMIKISDVSKRDKHGFNKWSFRKPGKKGM